MASSSSPSAPAPKARSPELEEEDQLDLEEARTALRKFKESGEAAVELGEVKRRLGLS